MITKRLLARSFEFLSLKLGPHKKIATMTSIALLALGSLYFLSRNRDEKVQIYQSKKEINFEGARTMDSGKSLYERKEQIFSARLKELEDQQKSVQESLEAIKNHLGGKGAHLNSSIREESDDEEDPGSTSDDANPEDVHFADPPSGLSAKAVRALPTRQRGSLAQAESAGPSIISFPVKNMTSETRQSVTLPSGSYVKAKLLTGVEAPEGKALPVLLQADFAFIGPNKTRVDLSGCFLIAKSTGNLSIERVEMQATKLSCVSRAGKMFEREINGFVADNKDNSFAVVGNVNSKQDRVAAMAFLSSIVEGIGKSVQQAQTVTESTGLGGTMSMISGSQAKFLAAGGATSAASMVTQWYLNQAQNLLPTINIGSGQDVWIVMQQSVDLPEWYFRKIKSEGEKGDVFTYLSRTAD